MPTFYMVFNSDQTGLPPSWKNPRKKIGSLKRLMKNCKSCGVFNSKPPCMSKGSHNGRNWGHNKLRSIKDLGQ